MSFLTLSAFGRARTAAARHKKDCKSLEQARQAQHEMDSIRHYTVPLLLSLQDIESKGVTQIELESFTLNLYLMATCLNGSGIDSVTIGDYTLKSNGTLKGNNGNE